jgi:hypothetical protein
VAGDAATYAADWGAERSVGMRKTRSIEEDTMSIAEILLLVAGVLYLFSDELRLLHRA